jgi:hypothetical protein
LVAVVVGTMISEWRVLRIAASIRSRTMRPVARRSMIVSTALTDDSNEFALLFGPTATEGRFRGKRKKVLPSMRMERYRIMAEPFEMATNARDSCRWDVCQNRQSTASAKLAFCQARSRTCNKTSAFSAENDDCALTSME